MTVGNQMNSHFFAQQMGRSYAPYPCRPHHGHPPQNQRIPLLCVTDHSSGHTEEWESLTPTRGATPKLGKTLHGALPYSLGNVSYEKHFRAKEGVKGLGHPPYLRQTWGLSVKPHLMSPARNNSFASGLFPQANGRNIRTTTMFNTHMFVQVVCT